MTGAGPPRAAVGGAVIVGWRGLVGTVTGVVLITVALLPITAAMVWVLARRRRAAGASAATAWLQSTAEVGIAYGTLPWVWMILLPLRPVAGARGRVHLVPLMDLVAVIGQGPTTAIVQVVGNLLVFAALGFFAPIRFSALASIARILALGAGCSVVVEVAQYVLRLDRVTSVDDVLLNATGAVLAALASRRWWRSSAVGRGSATPVG